MIARMMMGSVLAAAHLLGGCSTYGRQGQQVLDCATDEECNPGKTCGEMIGCVEGRCDPDDVTVVPCERICAGHDDCVLVYETCCCPDPAQEFTAIHVDDLEAWENRPACEDALCDPDACDWPEGLEARCQEGACITERLVGEQEACARDEDCVEVPAGCCPCQAGGSTIAVNRDHQEAYLRELEAVCAAADFDCPAFVTCTDLGAQCVDGRCATRIEACGCPDTWDPLCFPGQATYPNECVAACFGQEGIPAYYGHCDCQVACDWGDPRYGTQACAANGVTYELCGHHEVACNGQELLYPGACDPACDHCKYIMVVQVPVCVFDGYTYPDRCFAECLDRPWLHEGACLPGEGAGCGGFAGWPCEGENLYCTCPGCDCGNPVGGICVKAGHCIIEEDCLHLGPENPECEGTWACQEHECVWVCGG